LGSPCPNHVTAVASEFIAGNEVPHIFTRKSRVQPRNFDHECKKTFASYYVRDLCSTLGTIVNGEPIGNHFRGDDAPLQAGENEVIAGGVDSPFVFSLVIA
jgi:FHA domain